LASRAAGVARLPECGVAIAVAQQDRAGGFLALGGRGSGCGSGCHRYSPVERRFAGVVFADINIKSARTAWASSCPKVSSVEFGAGTPEAEAVVLLWLLANWVFNDANAPHFLEIWSFAKNLVLEIFGEAEFGHAAAGIAMTV
jgi:hypothetical protein